MAFTKVELTGKNFLASEVGLVLRTVTLEETNANVTTYTDVDGAVHKVIKAGTIYPTNDNGAKGIVFTDIDVTKGKNLGSLMVGGRYYNGKLLVAGVETPLNSNAKAVFVAQGLIGEDEPTTSVPADGTL